MNRQTDTRGSRRRRSGGGRRWSDLSGSQRTAVLVLGSIEAALTTVAAVDLYRRPAAGIRGPKAAWWPAIFVQPVGPIAYLVLGRRRATPEMPLTVDRG